MTLKIIVIACKIITCYNIFMKNILLVILFIIITLTVFAGGTKETLTMVFDGSIDYLEGDVFINGTRADFGSKVKDGDLINTGINSSCEIIFGQGNIFHLEQETIIEIKWTDNRISIKKGALGAVFSKLKNVLPKGEILKLDSPSATAGVRGTSFYIRVEDEKNTYICTCNGSLELSAGNKSIQTNTQYHKAYRFTTEGSVSTVLSAGLLYHQDEDMDKLASKIGTTIPWEKSSY
jgi:FecR protein